MHRAQEANCKYRLGFGSSRLFAVEKTACPRFATLLLVRFVRCPTVTTAATRSSIGIIIREVLVFVDPVTVEGESLE